MAMPGNELMLSISQSSGRGENKHIRVVCKQGQLPGRKFSAIYSVYILYSKHI